MHTDLPAYFSGVIAEELLAEAIAVGVPMNTRFRGTTFRQALLVKGPLGWAEFSPFPEYETPEAARWLSATIEAGWVGWPEARIHEVPINATVPSVPAEDVDDVLARFDGTSTVKVKVAEKPDGAAVAGIHGLEADIARVRAVRQALPEAKIRIDANQGWDQQQALTALEALAEFELEYAEQPVPGIERLAELRRALDARGIPVLLAADEAVRKAEDPLKVARLNAAEIIIVKVQPLGGVARAKAVVEASGLDAVVSSALDTSVGLSAGVRLAASLPVTRACGLGTASLFSTDVAQPSLKASGGVIASDALVAINEDHLESLALDAKSQQWWFDRALRALEYLHSFG